MCNVDLSGLECLFFSNSPCSILPHPFFFTVFPDLIHEFYDQEAIKLFLCLITLSILEDAGISSIKKAILYTFLYVLLIGFAALCYNSSFLTSSMFSSYIIERCFHQWKSFNFSFVIYTVFIYFCIYPNLVLTLIDLLWILPLLYIKHCRNKQLIFNYLINYHYYY